MIKQAFFDKRKSEPPGPRQLPKRAKAKQIDAIYSSRTNICVASAESEDLCHGTADTGSDAAWHFD